MLWISYSFIFEQPGNLNDASFSRRQTFQIRNLKTSCQLIYGILFCKYQHKENQTIDFKLQLNIEHNVFLFICLLIYLHV